MTSSRLILKSSTGSSADIRWADRWRREYVKGHPSAVEGIAFMAAYPADSTNLSALPIKVVSIHGSNDGLATDAKIQNSLKNLPADVKAVLIEGGNHAQFGNYGPQAGDGQATISREEQQRQTVTATLELANQLRTPVR